ncbi:MULTISPECIES: Stk1 family PASTA domain-containing Ser/Thr kinase [unclassified Diaminobutyricimonas]|uniref:Stk1 family PASTA domain-containing Ser/Thr kinase n=1 Tax=unclassified Diaminobutyricimonas TaxID=2643261 RepID=UPI0012F48664|nr:MULTISPECIES: Stk1 family PASTA domain-containing Ser/Thr kinase [unclassified Diaminobutyricimonas]
MIEGGTQALRQLAGRYEVGELIGHGGMADVHVGTDSRLGRRVAIKLLKPTLADDPTFRTRFRQEAQAAARMAHPTIVRVFDAGEETVTDQNGIERQLPFIVMEFVDGRLLKDIIAEGPMDPQEATRIAEGVLTALEYSHRAGVVHRDIKPGNIMVTPTGQVKVMDFGIARAISDSSATVAQTSVILGTAQYFSPEQARGESVDARTDLYSTGVVLFEMLTGRPPFRGDSPVAVAYQHVSEAPAPPSAYNPRVSPAIDAVVLHALAKDRFERFQSAAEFRNDVQAAAAGQVPTRRIDTAPDFNASLFGVNPNATAGSEATIRQLTVVPDRPNRSQNRPPVAWIWAGIAVMAVIVAAVLYWTFSLERTPLTEAVSVSVPDVAGQNYEDAEKVLASNDLVAQRFSEVSDTVPEGQVVSTIPGAGITVSPGMEIKVYVSIGKRQVAVPQLVRLDEASAIAAITEAGLIYGSSEQSYSKDVPAGVVMSSDPEGATMAREGETINLVVSNGLVSVPDVTGRSFADASSTMQSELGLQVHLTRDFSCSGQTIVAQSVVGDQPQRSDITLRYCAG